MAALIRACCSPSEEILNYVLVRVQPPMPGLPRPRFSLYLSAQLQIGVIRVYSQQCQYLVGKAGDPGGGRERNSPWLSWFFPPPPCPQKTSSTSWSIFTGPSCGFGLIWRRLTCESLELGPSRPAWSQPLFFFWGGGGVLVAAPAEPSHPLPASSLTSHILSQT